LLLSSVVEELAPVVVWVVGAVVDVVVVVGAVLGAVDAAPVDTVDTEGTFGRLAARR
jgi:hypothetical protein